MTATAERSWDSPLTSLIESAATGLAYGAALCWLGACLVASFRPNDLGYPYWNEIHRLRTDTSGAVSFVILALTLVTSEFLRLQRRRARALRPVGPRSSPDPFTTAVGEVAALLSTGLVVYLSVNAVTHPGTLLIRATHFATWPTEGTLRVAALLVSICSVAWLRYMTIRSFRTAWSDREGPMVDASTIEPPP